MGVATWHVRMWLKQEKDVCVCGRESYVARGTLRGRHEKPRGTEPWHWKG